ncbi:MAG: squalene--hopene cyclase [Rhodospirillaceae bacterium]|nr:squalene--hopene cyclase [Rhodospirillaceae bacterium]
MRRIRRVSVKIKGSPARAGVPASQPDIQPESDLEAAIQRSRDFLLSQQHPDGHWCFELMVDATLVADMVAYHHWDQSVDEVWQKKAVNHIFSMQLEDGGWNIYLNGPAEINATVKCYLALKLAGVPTTDPRMLKAREMAHNLGGPPRMNTFSKLYLALVGLYPWKHLPTIPVETILLGKFFHVNFYEMSSWSRSMLVPLAIINHYKPTRPVDVTLDELYPDGFHERDLKLPKDPEFLTWRNFFIHLDKLHKLAEWFAKKGIHPFRKRALRNAERWMLERCEGSSGLAAIFPAMLNCLIALKAMGYPDDHPGVIRAAKELKNLEHETEDRVWLEPCLSPVWDTGIIEICLHAAGVPADDESLRKTTDWLLDREIRFRGDWKFKNNADVEPSGWAFEYDNKWNPDVDDTAMILMALRRVPGSDRRRRDAALERGLKWMLSFQCKDGGWGAFDKDCTKNILNKVPFADHNAMLDPECADITARILEFLGQEGYDLDDPQVKKAIQFLRENQEEDGSWYGRWGVNYIYGTWAVLRGLRSIGLDMNQPWLQKARRWLETAQNDDGGWGERCNTYDDPIYKAQGPSTASQTAWAIMGLQSFGETSCTSISRGIEYLVRNQNADGSWTENETTGTGFPRVFYLKYDSYRNAWPLLALAEQQEHEKLNLIRNGHHLNGKQKANGEYAGAAR